MKRKARNWGGCGGGRQRRRLSSKVMVYISASQLWLHIRLTWGANKILMLRLHPRPVTPETDAGIQASHMYLKFPR